MKLTDGNKLFLFFRLLYMRKNKSALQKKKDNPNSLYYQRKALKAWREICVLRFNNKCAVCNCTEKLEAHHIISKKTCKSIMYSIPNQLLLCTKHHNFFGKEGTRFSAHKHPIAFYQFIKEKYPDLYFEIWAIDIEQEKKKKITTKDYYDEFLKILNDLKKNKGI